MNDIEFIETLKQKRNACDYSQSRLAQELQISRQNLNEIENGKTKASKEMKHILLHYLDYCNCTQPFTLTIDYLRVRFPTTDALEIIKNVLAMKSEYFIHEDYGMFGYEEQYIYGDISVNASKVNITVRQSRQSGVAIPGIINDQQVPGEDPLRFVL